MKKRENFSLLVQELHNDYSYIRESVELRNKALTRVQASAWTDELDHMVLGSCLHNLYNAFEAYLLRVAKFFENSVDEHMWHRDLVDRMALDIPGIRPALITDRTLLARIDELRRFRHVFRNLYKNRLHPGKLRIVSEAAEGIDQAFLPMHEAFVRWLEDVAAQLESFSPKT